MISNKLGFDSGKFLDLDTLMKGEKVPVAMDDKDYKNKHKREYCINAKITQLFGANSHLAKYGDVDVIGPMFMVPLAWALGDFRLGQSKPMIFYHNALVEAGAVSRNDIDTTGKFLDSLCGSDEGLWVAYLTGYKFSKETKDNNSFYKMRLFKETQRQYIIESV